MFSRDHEFSSGELQELFKITKWTVSRLAKDGLLLASDDVRDRRYSIGIAFTREEVEGQAARAWLVAAAARRDQEQRQARFDELPARVESSGGGGASIEPDEEQIDQIPDELPARVIEPDEEQIDQIPDELPARVIALSSYREYGPVFDSYPLTKRLKQSARASLADYLDRVGINAEQARAYLGDAGDLDIKHYQADSVITDKLIKLISSARHKGRMISYKITMSLITSNALIVPAPRVVCVIAGPPKMVVIELQKEIGVLAQKVQLCVEYQAYIQHRATDAIKRAWIKALHDQRLESLGLPEGVYIAAQESINQTLRELADEQAKLKRV